MKKIFTISLFVVASVIGVVAQKNDLAVSAVYAKQGADLKVESIKIDADKDDPGFQVEYTRFVTKYLGVGMEAGVTFGGKDRTGEVISCGANCTRTKNSPSKIGEGYFNYTTVLQRRKGTVQPFVKGMVGAKRTDFGGTTFINGRGKTNSGNLFVAGGGVGVDIKLKKNLFWRTSLTVTKVINQDISGVDAKAASGLSFRF